MPVTRQKNTTKHCPYCAELIRREAVKCRFCGEFLYGDRDHSCARTVDEPEQDVWEEDVVDEDEEFEEDYEEEYDGQDEELDEDSGQDSEEAEDDLNLVLYCGRPSIFTLSGSLIKWGIIAAICAAPAVYPVGNLFNIIPQVDLSEQQILTIEYYVRNTSVILTSIILLGVLLKIAQLKSIYYEVSADRIEYGRGIFSRKVDNLDMFRIVDLKLRRSLFDCLIGVGTIRLKTKDDSDPDFDFVKVRHCRYLYDVLKKATLKADKDRGVIHLD